MVSAASVMGRPDAPATLTAIGAIVV